MKIDTSIKGLQEVQAAAVQVVGALQPDGSLGEAVRYMTATVHRYVTARTVVDSGSWRASHRPEIHGLRGRVFIDPGAVNPQSGGRPAEYGTTLALTLGGRYNPYKTTYEQEGPTIVAEAAAIVRRGLP